MVFLCCVCVCVYDVDTSWMFSQRPATTRSTTALTHIRGHDHWEGGRGHDFEKVCNYCRKSLVFVQTDTCEWGFVKVIRLISIKLVSIRYFDHCVQGFAAMARTIRFENLRKTCVPSNITIEQVCNPQCSKCWFVRKQQTSEKFISGEFYYGHLRSWLNNSRKNVPHNY